MIQNTFKFKPTNPLNTAVLFLVFNRLDSTKQVFDSIREAKPPRLYIASDGPRKKQENETEKVQAVREYVTSHIDWKCDVKTLFREENLGCKYAVSGAIDWFFENEEMGIIIEDDCLPSQSFFWFCEEMLERYKDDFRVGLISGDNFQKGKKRGDADYYFSVYSHIWGWASWANRWRNYDVELNNINDSKFIESLFRYRDTREYWMDKFSAMKKKKIDTWDYQWTFTLWHQNQLSILPNVNLISNIGFGEYATHTTKDSDFSKLDSKELIVKMHPKNIQINKDADDFTSRLMFRKNSLFKRVINKVKALLK